MKPYFLIGAERSGTTLLRLMLDAHPLISWLNEFEYAVDKIVSSDGWPDLDSYADWLSTHRVFRATGFSIDRSLNYPSLVKSFLAQKRQKDKKPIIGATCHRHYDRLLRIFPQAKFIYLLRDPRDVARSNIGMGWAGNVWYGVDRWIKAEELWRKIKSHLANNHYFEVRYEELITYPEDTLEVICQFLNIQYDRRMLGYPEYTTYSRPNPDLIEQWKKKLSLKELEVVEFKAKGLMTIRGYNFRSDTQNKPSSTELLFLYLQNKCFKINFRIQRFGLGLFLSDYLTRKLNLSGWNRELRMKMNAIEKKYLK
jgi:hypothetical protein